MIFDDQTAMALSKGRIQISEKKLATINVPELFTQFGLFTKRLLGIKQETQFKVELKAFIDTRSEDPDNQGSVIYQGYLMTYGIKIT